jgi:hypothetical protein
LRNLKLTVRTKTLRTCKGASMTFKKGYQPRCNIVNDEKGDLVADSHSIVDRWRNYFSHLFNVHGVKDAGQAEIYAAEPLVPEPLRLSWLSTS